MGEGRMGWLHPERRLLGGVVERDYKWSTVAAGHNRSWCHNYC